MTDGPSEKPWSLVHYACLRSAVEHIRPDAVHLYYEFEPRTAWWEVTEPFVTKIKIKAPEIIHGRVVHSPAHRADIVRLMALIEYGGIYLDADMMVHRSFDPLLTQDTVLGEEGADRIFGVSNAVILSRPHSVFLARWLDQYRWFRGGRTHHEPFWNEHSVQLPSFMTRLFPNEVTVLNDRAFYWPLWTEAGLNMMFNSDVIMDISHNYATHLWESHSWPFLQNLTPGQVRAMNNNFSRWVRPYLEDLPDNFGMEPSNTSSRTSLSDVSPSHDGSVSEPPAPDALQRQRAFQQTYAQHLWGNDGQSRFFSGIGSRGSAVTTYIDAMVAELEKLRHHLKRSLVIVDIGCGDFFIGKKLMDGRDDRYIGCDIVPELIAFNDAKHTSQNIEFRRLDAVTDEFPKADVYLIREVFQHLTNDEIHRVVAKLKRCEDAAIYITEAQPRQVKGDVNPDKPKAGAEIRFDWRTGLGRGVELDQPPYNVPLKLICRVEMQKQFIDTFKIVSPGCISGG